MKKIYCTCTFVLKSNEEDVYKDKILKKIESICHESSKLDDFVLMVDCITELKAVNPRDYFKKDDKEIIDEIWDYSSDMNPDDFSTLLAAMIDYLECKAEEDNTQLTWMRDDYTWLVDLIHDTLGKK